MSDLENRIFNSTKKPPIYLRYVDDILILTNNINEINILQDTFHVSTWDWTPVSKAFGEHSTC